MSTQCHDTATGTPDIPQQQLQDGRSADNLHAVGMLRPSERITDAACLFLAGCGSEGFSDPQKQVARHTARTLDHFRRIAGKMPLQDLVDTSRMLQGLVTVT